MWERGHGFQVVSVNIQSTYATIRHNNENWLACHVFFDFLFTDFLVLTHSFVF